MRVKAYVNMTATKSVLISMDKDVSELTLPQEAREIIDNTHYVKEFDLGKNHLYLKEGEEPSVELETRGFYINDIESRHQKNLQSVLENCVESGKRAN